MIVFLDRLRHGARVTCLVIYNIGNTFPVPSKLQSLPVYPLAHSHEKSFRRSVHVPPLAHGVSAHSSISKNHLFLTNHLRNINSGICLQIYVRIHYLCVYRPQFQVCISCTNKMNTTNDYYDDVNVLLNNRAKWTYVHRVIRNRALVI